jgi:hypothetical protein
LLLALLGVAVMVWFLSRWFGRRVGVDRTAVVGGRVLPSGVAVNGDEQICGQRGHWLVLVILQPYGCRWKGR